MASVPTRAPDFGPVKSPPTPTAPPSELPPMPGDIDQPAPIDEPGPDGPAQQAVG